jgi:hypothetical protein
MRRVRDVWRSAGVRNVYLVHGTFVGGDALGWWGAIARRWPDFGRNLHALGKQWIDSIAGDCGNYTAHFARTLAEGLASDTETIAVRRFLWSSANHHLARAAAAIKLLVDLREHGRGGRTMFWGHSHAGNVFAIMSNLRAGDAAANAEFFDAIGNAIEWNQHRDELRLTLLRGDDPLEGAGVDFVTFGTPIRYGWDLAGCDRLLHVVNHACDGAARTDTATFPPKIAALQSVAGGDFVQQLGIAGTNAPPTIFQWRDWRADRALGRLLERNLPRQRVWERWQAGRRVADDGVTLLVDYGKSTADAAALLGHGVYTKLDHLLFHAEQVCRLLYSAEVPAADDEVADAAA